MATIETRTIPARETTDPVTGKPKRTRAVTKYDARWRDADGRSRRKAFDRKADAAAYLKQIEKATEAKVDTSVKARKQTLRAFAETYLANRRGATLSSSTKSLYDLTLSTVPFADKPMVSVTPQDVEDWLAALGRDGRVGVDRQGRPVLKKALSIGTRRMHAARVRVLFNAAVRRKLLVVSPYDAEVVAEVLGKRNEDQEAVAPQRLPDHEVVARLVAAMNPRYRVGLQLAAYCGLRSGELRALAVEDFDHLHRRLHVRAGMRRERQGDGSPEVRGRLKTRHSATGPEGMQLPQALADEIQAHVERHADASNPAAPLMPSERGDFVDANTFGFFFRQARKKAGAPEVRLHDLRHFAVSSLIEAGGSVADAQKLARHSSARITLGVYTHSFSDSASNNADRMGQVFALSRGATG